MGEKAAGRNGGPERIRLLRSDSCPSLRRLPSLAQSDFLSDCPHRDVHWTSHRGRSLASSPLSNHSRQISAELIFLPAEEADESATEPYKEVRRESGEDDDDGWEKKQPGEMADPRGFEPLTFASVVRRSNPTELRVQPNRLKESGV